MKRAVRVVPTVLFLFVFVWISTKVISMEWLERQLVFYPSRILEGSPKDFGLKYEEVTFQASDGVKLHGWYVPSPTERARLLFFHGNAGNISGRTFHLPEFIKRGISVFFMDYRGYGKSEGVPNELGIYADAEAALAWLKERGPKDVPTVYYGESLGSAVAVELAVSTETPHRIILEGAFTCARDMAKIMYSFLGTALPLHYRFDSVAKIKKVRCPLLSIHGTEDDVVPFTLGRQLYEAHPGPKEFWEVRGAHHNDLLSVAGLQFYDRVAEFIFKN